MNSIRNLTGQDVRIVKPEHRAATTHHPERRAAARVVIEGLPAPEAGVTLIVTPEVLAAACGRADLVTPADPCEGGYLALRGRTPLDSHDITAVGREMVALLRQEEERPGINLAYRAALVAARTALDNVCRCFW